MGEEAEQLEGRSLGRPLLMQVQGRVLPLAGPNDKLYVAAYWVVGAAAILGGIALMNRFTQRA